jgi:hypothetical protein
MEKNLFFAVIIVFLAAFANGSWAMAECPPDCDSSHNSGWVYGGVDDRMSNETTFDGPNVQTGFEATDRHYGGGQYQSGDFSGRVWNSSSQFDGYNRTVELTDGFANHTGSNYQEAYTEAGVNAPCPEMSIEANQRLDGQTRTGRGEPSSDMSRSMAGYLNVNGNVNSEVNGDPPIGNYMYQIGSHGYYQEWGSSSSPSFSWQGANTQVETIVGSPPAE